VFAVQQMKFRSTVTPYEKKARAKRQLGRTKYLAKATSRGVPVSMVTKRLIKEYVDQRQGRSLETKEAAFYADPKRIRAAITGADLVVPIPIVPPMKTGSSTNAIESTNCRKDTQITVFKSDMTIHMAVGSDVSADQYPKGILFDVRVFSIKGIGLNQPSNANPVLTTAMNNYLVNPDHGAVGVANNNPYKPITGRSCDGDLGVNRDSITIHKQINGILFTTARSNTGGNAFLQTNLPSTKRIKLFDVPGFKKVWKYEPPEVADGDRLYYPTNVQLYVSVSARNADVNGPIPEGDLGNFTVESNIYYKDA